MSLSLRTQLVLLLGALVLAATASLGSIAYLSSRAMIEAGVVRDVGITANARKQALIRELTEQKVRAAALLETAELGCEPDETPCLRKILADFVATGGATAARLVYRGRAPIVAGRNASHLATAAVPTAGQIALFDLDEKRSAYYVVGARMVSKDGEAVITLRGDMNLVDQIFQDRYGLGQSGETFLKDAQGRFLTSHRYAAPAGGENPAGDKAIQLCLAGSDSEVLDRDYRGVAVIHGFRYVPEIGGGCVVTQIDQAEAFAPTNVLRRSVVAVSVLLAAVAIACSLLFAQLVSRPIHSLEKRARSLQGGDYDSPVPIGGPYEVRTFAQTFQTMARSLKDSRLDLERSAEQMSNILESISEGFCAFDRDWKCTYVNVKAAALLRAPREQLLGKVLWEMLPQELSARVRAPLIRTLTEGVPTHFEEYYQPFDAWFEFNACPTQDGLAVLGRDVSERKRFNERLQQMQKLESLGVLAGGIAHDFNNLLTGIMGNASMVLDDLPRDSRPHGDLQKVVDASERAAMLTQQLLAYAGKGRFVIEPVNLSEVVRKISYLIQASVPRTVELRLQLADDLPATEGDAAQIQQLVMNLVINGAEAIEKDKTGTVIVSTSLKQVDQTYLQQTFGPHEISPGSYVMLEVSDTGCGMDDATKARIFDPFFTTKFAGRGLGLAAVLGIVRGHKGALRVYSVPGKGSSFKVLLPVSARVASREPVNLGKDLKGSGTILVIDDEELVRQLSQSALARYGYTVLAAENGPKGIEVLRTNVQAVDLVLLDMTMPLMSGEETFQHLKTIRPDLPVILCSGYHEVEYAERFAGKGLAGFIQKPFTAAYLAERIKTTLTHVGGD
jgi:PAS domain S-box-containing protein